MLAEFALKDPKGPLTLGQHEELEFKFPTMQIHLGHISWGMLS